MIHWAARIQWLICLEAGSILLTLWPLSYWTYEFLGPHTHTRMNYCYMAFWSTGYKGVPACKWLVVLSNQFRVDGRIDKSSETLETKRQVEITLEQSDNELMSASSDLSVPQPVFPSFPLITVSSYLFSFTKWALPIDPVTALILFTALWDYFHFSPQFAKS